MTIIPDLGHMPDLIALKLHDIHVVRLKAFTCGRNRATDFGVRATENPIDDCAIANRVNTEGTDLVMTVRHRSKHRLHPFRISLQRRNIFKGVRLRSKTCIVMAILPTYVPTLPRLTGIKK